LSKVPDCLPENMDDDEASAENVFWGELEDLLGKASASGVEDASIIGILEMVKVRIIRELLILGERKAAGDV